MLTLLESFETVLEKEREAERILLEAKEEAEQLKKKAQEKAEEVYRKTYQATTAQVKRKSIEIKKQARMDAERDAQIFLTRAEKQKEKILKDTEEKFSEAVNAVINEILT